MMITVTNNKRKSLANSELILNYDFVKEALNSYNIYEKAIIVNLEGDIKISKKRFNGINVNNYELYSSKIEDYFDFEMTNNFYIRDLVEAKFYKQGNFTKIRQNIQRKHFKIKCLYGNNGKVF